MKAKKREMFSLNKWGYVDSLGRGRRPEVFAGVEEIHQVSPLRAEPGLHLVGDPRRAVPHRM